MNKTINVPIDFLKENLTRYRKLAKGEKVDYAPFRFWLDDTYVRYYTGISPEKYRASFETMLEAQKQVDERFYGLRDYAVEVDYMDIYYDREKYRTEYPDGLPGRFLEKSLDDFDKFYSTEKFEDTPGVKKLIEGIEYFNKNLPEHKHVGHYLGATGCMDLFSIFRGTKQFFMDLYDNHAKVKQIFEYLTERSLEWIEWVEKNLKQYNGENFLFDKVDIGEDYCAYLTPDLFDDFVVPYTGKIFEEYQDKALCSLHTDGDMPPSGIHKLADANIEELSGFSPNIDIKEYRRALPDVILGGNIHPIEVMIEGTPEDVKKAAKYCFENANQNQKFILCTGGAISAGAKEENVDAFLEAAYEVVKY